jgi:uncharacterized membrane protein YgaE (UPF0421/DUF939 family)
LRSQFTAVDIKNAGMITLSCAMATILSKWLALPELIWMVVIAALLPFSKYGVTALKRHINLAITGVTAAVLVSMTILFNSIDWMVIPWLFISAFILYCLPRYIAGSSAAGLFVLVFMVIAHSMPGSSFVAVKQAVLGILLGTLIVIFLNGLFDRDKTLLPPIELDRSLYLLQRALRVAILITVAFLICHFFNIQNASWVALTVIIVDQNTLGAGAKKAYQRVLGTALGVIAGILLAHFLFAPYPLSRWLALLIVFLVFLFVRVNYTLCIFFATILLANIFYLLSGSADIIHYMVSRLVDIFIGIAVGIIGQMLLFPKSLVICLREAYTRFWSDVDISLSLFSLDLRLQALTKLDQDLKNIEQSLKDFRYEPISFLFKRYHLSVSLIPLIKNFLISLKKVQILPQQVSVYSSQSIQVLLSFYRNPELNSVTSLENSLLELAQLQERFSDSIEIKSFLISFQKLIEHFRRIIQVSRWRLELK